MFLFFITKSIGQVYIFSQIQKTANYHYKSLNRQTCRYDFKKAASYSKESQVLFEIQVRNTFNIAMYMKAVFFIDIDTHQHKIFNEQYLSFYKLF